MAKPRPNPFALDSRRALVSRALTAAAIVGLFLGGLYGCKPEIGDRCAVSTECSTRGDRLCDTSQPGGYCTQLNCARGSCADEASCVLFGSSLPGCRYDDRAGAYGSRVARSFCMARCESQADCREGYTCSDPRSAPWSATILDDDQTKRSCLPTPVTGPQVSAAPPSVGSAAVCGPVAPPVSDIDASAPRVASDGGAPMDGGPDADAGVGDGG